jgi:glycosyltransferase involved in cell wall biosynthesis
VLHGKTVGVVMPAYNEERLIDGALTAVPDLVDRIIVVNDGSEDRTLEIIERRRKHDPRIVVLNHAQNRGLGQSLIDGYLRSRELELDVTVTMDGDAQMSPDDLPRIVEPVALGRADYCKGNRLLHRDVTAKMPAYRLFGNAALTFLTKFATGYWQMMDPQCAYAAISRRALAALPIERMTKRYGYNADMLNMLNIQNFRVAMVEVRPVYGAAQSGIRLRSYIPRVSRLLVRLFFRRLLRKYLVRNFNPLCLSYLSGLFLLCFGTMPFTLRILYVYFVLGTEFPQTSFLCLMFVTIAALQILLSAVQYDMEDNRDLFFTVEPGGETELRRATVKPDSWSAPPPSVEPPMPIGAGRGERSSKK